MENASKALIMAAGVLLGVMIIGIGSFLIQIFGRYSADAEEDRYQKQLAEFNSRFTKYENAQSVTIHEVVSLANFAIENNTLGELQNIDFDQNKETDYIRVKLDGQNLEKKSKQALITLLDTKAYDTEKGKEILYKCVSIQISPKTKKVNYIEFKHV